MSGTWKRTVHEMSSLESDCCLETYAEAYRLGKKDAEAAVIKKLEAYVSTFYKLSPNSDAVKYPIEGAIALIRGETE